MLGHLLEAQHDQATATLKGAFKMDGKERMVQFEKYATWLERNWPTTANSLRERLEDVFIINRLGRSSEVKRCLGTPDLIDNGHSTLRDQVRRVKHRQNRETVLGWTAAALDAIAMGFRWIVGYTRLGRLKAALNEPSPDRSLVDQSRAY